MINAQLIFNESGIFLHDGTPIMMKWEEQIMRAHAKVVATGGDVLEIGFGMGISATYIQQFGARTHTIVEPNPQVLERATAWAKGRPGVKIVIGRWFDALDELETYDSIFYDAELDPNLGDLVKTVETRLIRKGGVFTFHNPQMPYGLNVLQMSGIEYDGPYDISEAVRLKVSYASYSNYWVPIKRY